MNIRALPVQAMVEILPNLAFNYRPDMIVCLTFFSECAAPLGMKDRTIPDNSITASSEVKISFNLSSLFRERPFKISFHSFYLFVSELLVCNFTSNMDKFWFDTYKSTMVVRY